MQTGQAGHIISSMPELPEVETVVRAFGPPLVGRTIVRYVSRWAKQASPSTAAVRRGVEDRRIARVWRRGKFIVFDLAETEGENRSVISPRTAGPEKPNRSTTSPCATALEQCDVPNQPRSREEIRGTVGHMLIHLRMSGRFEWADSPERPPRHVRAYFELDDGRRLLFCDSRKFGRIVYTDDLASAVGELGIEPLGPEFSAQRFAKMLRARRRLLKPLLLDQSVVAGIGNIYADESLFEAGLHPLTRSDDLRDEQIRRLWRSIRAVLRKAIRKNGTTIDWIYLGGNMQQHLNVYGRTGEPCRVCKTPIEALRVGQRGTHICPACQPLRGRA
ncbi:DNA-formamidopyrimidine glycosylase [uncultured Ilyobacter sp.]|uniref:DNA-formamidopyrimidine glycosylase n=1 Tax=uncultured Ilyobacter sp. TaxID=544433 RepID=UPI00374A3B12